MAHADAGEFDLARLMMPGTVPEDPIAIETELLLVNLVARLQRAVTEPGSGDRDFLRGMRGVKPAILSDSQRAHVMRLAWRYRLQLPPGLRPARNPDHDEVQ